MTFFSFRQLRSTCKSLLVDLFTSKLFTLLTLIPISSCSYEGNIFTAVTTLFISGSQLGFQLSAVHRRFYRLRHGLFYTANIALFAYFTACLLLPEDCSSSTSFLLQTRPLIDLTFHIHSRSKRATTSFYVIVLLVCFAVTVTHRIINWSRSPPLQCIMAMMADRLDLFRRLFPNHSQQGTIQLLKKYINFGSGSQSKRENKILDAATVSSRIHRILQFILVLETFAYSTVALVCLYLNWCHHFDSLPLQLAIHLLYFYYFNLGALEGVYLNSSHFVVLAIAARIHQRLLLKTEAIVERIFSAGPEGSKKSRQIARLRALFADHCTLNRIILQIEAAYRAPVLLIVAAIAPISIVLTNMLLFDHLISWYAKLMMAYVVLFCHVAFYFVTFYFSAINRLMFSLERPARRLLLFLFAPLGDANRKRQLFRRLKLLHQYEYLSGGLFGSGNGSSGGHQVGITIGGIAVITPFISFKILVRYIRYCILQYRLH